MGSLISFLGEDLHDITYSDLATVELDEKEKPKESWMKNWTQKQRTAKFFDFCVAYDKREDSLLKDNYQQFSHRLHWHECPFVDEVSKIKDPLTVLNACVLFSFTNEHWQTYLAWKNNALKERMESNVRHARSDLFQIYYPKGTDVKKWLMTGPSRCAESMHNLLGSKNRPYTMMEFAKLLNTHFVDDQGFKNAMYPCKNAARHVAMSHPEWVDPESFLHGGTGFFDGLSQVLACPNYMSKAQYQIDENGQYIPTNKAGHEFVQHMKYLVEHPLNPIKKQKYLNVEDKLCMYYKHLAIRNGVKQQTKQIPYEWVYPSNWSLKTGKYNGT